MEKKRSNLKGEKINKNNGSILENKEKKFFKNLYVKQKKIKTDKKYGKLPSKRDIEELLNKGIIIIDKHKGPTSHQVVDSLKKILKIKKAGHSGTLDPKVTGVLVCGLGKGTKLMEYLLKSGKEYVCLMYIHKQLEEKLIRETILSFKGKIKQKPPVISAVKRVERIREIYDIKVLEIEKQYILFSAYVEHGTYIRKLCHDIGEKLGCGAHMVELRRIKAGNFSEKESIGLTKLADFFEIYEEMKKKENSKKLKIIENELKKYIFPMEKGLRGFKKVYVLDSAVGRLSLGGDLAIPGVVAFDKNIEVGDIVVLYTLKEEVISVGVALLNSKDVLKKKKGFFIKTNKVFMEPGIYPIPWKNNNKKD